jgi:hypothetical protein
MEKESNAKDVFHFRINREFKPVWREFKQLAASDNKLLEMHYITLEKNARPLAVVMRNLITKYVNERNNGKKNNIPN